MHDFRNSQVIFLEMHFLNGYEYTLFSLPFTVLSYCGFWSPKKCSLKTKWIQKYIRLYLYTSVAISIIQLILDFLINQKFKWIDLQLIISLSIGAFKLWNLGQIRGQIIHLVRNCCTIQWHSPKCEKEKKLFLQIQAETK